jgi:hypothetical protein
LTITNPTRSSTTPLKGWAEDPRMVVRQVTHAVEPGHLVALCGVRVAHLGDPWTEVTRLGRCNVCRQVVARLDETVEVRRAPRR